MASLHRPAAKCFGALLKLNPRFQSPFRSRHFRSGNRAKETLKPRVAPMGVPDRVKISPVQATHQKIGTWCGTAVVILYFLRGSVFPWYLHIPSSLLIIANVLVLTAAAGIAVFGAGQWRIAWVFVLLAFAASLSQAEQVTNSALRSTGLMLLMVAVGPVILNPSAIVTRAAAWRLVVDGLALLAAIFVVWYGLRLPNFGAGYFSAFMNQCMLAGPLAGMGGAIAMVRALHLRSWKWGLLAILGIAPVLASGSRVATLATAATYGFILICRKPALGWVGVLLMAGGIFAFLNMPERGLDPVTDSLTGALAYKGTANTRADLWAARIAEFKSSPLLGIGVAMGTGSGSEVEVGGNIRVEPGSSYLAILAMTGLFGTVAFCIALSLLLYDFVQTSDANVESQIVCGIGVFLAVHGLAEGWVLGFGSPLCFLFWLWLGRVGDLTPRSVRAKSGYSRQSLRRFAPTQPAPICKSAPSEPTLVTGRQ